MKANSRDTIPIPENWVMSPNFYVPEFQFEVIASARTSLLVMAILIHPHARERMVERGTTEAEVRTTIHKGAKFSARFGRIGFRKEFPFESDCDGKVCRIKQVIVYGVEEGNDFIVITVIAYIRFRQKSKGVETRQISSEINIDISADGKIYGIELLNAKEQLIKEKKISFTDESTGKAFEVPLKF
jgi:uncharacterized protein YuzE